jgi:hypothetical protein
LWVIRFTLQKAHFSYYYTPEGDLSLTGMEASRDEGAKAYQTYHEWELSACALSGGVKT